MKRSRIVALAIVVIALVVAIAGSCVLVRWTNLDRDAPEYRARMHRIWPAEVPGKIPNAAPDFDSAFLRVLFANELEAETPYLLAFPLAGSQPAPAVLILPGGGYSFRSEKIEGTEIAEWLNSIGIAAFVLDYRVSPHRHPIPWMDATRAIRWVRANATAMRVDPRRVAVLGSSAGGHLAAMLGTRWDHGDPVDADRVERESSRPDALILCQPVISMTDHVHEGSKRRLLGEHPSAESVSATSVEQHVTVTTPPTFVWTSRDDDMVDYRHSVLFADALARHSVVHELHVFPSGNHGRGLAKREKYTRAWPELCARWLERIGWQ